MALQNSALIWSAGHRVHHRFIDDPERDPYCARRGFWFSHIGWMLRNYPSGDPDLKYVRELQNDPLVAFQHRHYLALAVGMNVGVPLLLGWAFGNIVGMLLLAGVLRLVISHHLTFCINSLAHIVGTRPTRRRTRRATMEWSHCSRSARDITIFITNSRTITATACAGGNGIPPSG
jgi:stearoyl-CoA desaturase (Delta-9 desaturase)